jgi:hypothetical protein
VRAFNVAMKIGPLSAKISEGEFQALHEYVACFWGTTGDREDHAVPGGGQEVLEIEVVCSDVQEHRRRVESRGSDIEGAHSADMGGSCGASLRAMGLAALDD